MIDAIPTWAGGEPAGAPDRPTTVAEYPPVNDRPPPRDTKLITEEEQAKAERDLMAARNSQAAEAKGVKDSRDQILGNTPTAQAKPVAAAPGKPAAKNLRAEQN